nr:cobaltochelatase subunit CobN [Chthonobacter albigriseus]
MAEQIRSLDETVPAIDLGQSPAEVVILSFSDSDLGLVAAVHEKLERDSRPTLRLASLAALRHPYSVDLYIEKVVNNARVVIVRCLGGMDYWRYGLDELAIAARTQGFALAVVPGDGKADPRLDEVSTVPEADLRRIWGWFQAGGAANVTSLFSWIDKALGGSSEPAEPVPLAPFGCFPEACGCGGDCSVAGTGNAGDSRPVALLLFYRSLLAAADTVPIVELVQALGREGLVGVPLYVTSLKDRQAVAGLTDAIDRIKPDVILNTTAFSARPDDGPGPLDRANCPVIQAVTATTFHAAWLSGQRGLTATDLAMNVVLPEVDGRIDGPAISFKADLERSEVTEFARVFHRPEAAGISRAATLAANWARLRRMPNGDKRLALVLSDYPVKGGRTGYAVGLDGPASIEKIVAELRLAGFDVGLEGGADGAVRRLEEGGDSFAVGVVAYRSWFRTLPEDFQAAVTAAWGEPEADPDVSENAFRIKALGLGKLAVMVQPDRGRRAERAGEYHDPALPPRHGYVAGYMWLRSVWGIDAMIHLGTHGTIEWLPGKSVALSPSCAPVVLMGPTPVIYPFIVNNPGEAAQAKRRIGAVTLGHMTPPLSRAGTHGATAEIEALLDEFAAAQTLDPRRAQLLADLILEKAEASGLAAETGLDAGLDRAAALARLDAFVCDLKDMRIGDGLHMFGEAPDEGQVAAMAEAIGTDAARLGGLMRTSAIGERQALIAALEGRFVQPGPAGAPASGRLDVLPTGRNIYAVDPRSVPTRTAYDIGAKVAEAVVARYVQDHGDWPKRMVLDLWGSASMRTGGEDLGQAFALLGVRPTWDAASSRVSGFEVLSTARTGRPRVDVTLRISGLFRDVFPTQIALFDQAVKAVAALDEDAETNPLAASAGDGLEPRIYGPAAGAYGVGIAGRVASGSWDGRDDLAALYLDAGGFAYGGDADGERAAEPFRRRVAAADAFVHVQDMAGQDVLDSDAFAEHEGGFAAAARMTGGAPALYHVDATHGEDQAVVRTLSEEIVRVVRARATNPRWISGQMRHGHRGAAEIAETVGNLLTFAAAADVVENRQFDLVFDATLGDDAVRDFMVGANPRAAAACAKAFDEALRRGLWTTRRNSVAGRIAETLERAA